MTLRLSLVALISLLLVSLLASLSVTAAPAPTEVAGPR
ncbi:hypothetical protein C7455_106153 [Roseicyclus mahoneyensis]|uniref:Uncharacterized protein n=1 Tax=Roseicyclus mahoneyensis TaxID=164332 RepID=A0A316GG19_9RHOB|nr:hypothetical protein C7455_106153 [Roseicyclus mahoneyensis]